LQSRIGNVLTFARRYRRWVPLCRIEVERVKFDLALLQNPELTGVEYQRGELFGWEIRSYILEKFGRQCAYCRPAMSPLRSITWCLAAEVVQTGSATWCSRAISAI
jgi:hypothetical protein